MVNLVDTPPKTTPVVSKIEEEREKQQANAAQRFLLDVTGQEQLCLADAIAFYLKGIKKALAAAHAFYNQKEGQQQQFQGTASLVPLDLSPETLEVFQALSSDLFTQFQKFHDTVTFIFTGNFLHKLIYFSHQLLSGSRKSNSYCIVQDLMQNKLLKRLKNI